MLLVCVCTCKFLLACAWERACTQFFYYSRKDTHWDESGKVLAERCKKEREKVKWWNCNKTTLGLCKGECDL